MNIDLNIDASALEERFKLSEKNVAFAVVNAINATAKQLQEAERENVRQKFTIRKNDFMMRQAAIIKPFASVGQGRPYAEVGVGQKPRLLLSTFEHGGVKNPVVGAKVAVPITGSPSRPGFDQSVPGSLFISALNLHPELSAAQKAQRKSIKGGSRKETAAMRKDFTKANASGQPWQGRERTYLVPGVGVFQRTGPKRRDTQLIYKFVPRPQLHARLGFVALAQQQGQRLLDRNMETAVIGELARSRR